MFLQTVYVLCLCHTVVELGVPFTIWFNMVEGITVTSVSKIDRLQKRVKTSSKKERKISNREKGVSKVGKKWKKTLQNRYRLQKRIKTLKPDKDFKTDEDFKSKQRPQTDKDFKPGKHLKN